MIDLHAHVLPGVDDGARDLEESLAMLRLAEADGTRVVCATPHAHGPDYDVAEARAESAWKALAERARDAGLRVTLDRASEVWYRPDLADLARAGRLRGYPAVSTSARRRVLVEFPPTHVPPEAAETFFALRLEGYDVVVAHPERNVGFWQRPEDALALRAQGALLQVTAGSLTGLFRRESKECARSIAKAGAIDLLASDCHRRDRRPPGLSDARRILARWCGEAAAERATEAVPAAILAGQPIPPPV